MPFEAFGSLGPPQWVVPAQNKMGGIVKKAILHSDEHTAVYTYVHPINLLPYLAFRIPSYECSWDTKPGLGLTQDRRHFTYSLACLYDMVYSFIK